MVNKSNYIKVMPFLSLDDLKFVILNSSLVIGNDTGPTHIAWGINIPSITIFGPTPTDRVYQTKINKVIKSSSKVDHFNLDKNDYSISDIEVEDIVKISQELLQINL
jgi:heptosyltransferase-1